jgi:hypothetical protein
MRKARAARWKASASALSCVDHRCQLPAPSEDADRMDIDPSGLDVPADMGISPQRLSAMAHGISQSEINAKRQEMGALTEDQYKASAFFRKDIPYDPGMTSARAEALASMNDAQKVREFYAQKRPFSAFLGNMAGQALDPINYVPVAGEAVKAAALARMGGIAGHALVGALDAAGNTAIFGVGTSGMRAQFGDDVSWEALTSQIATAALIGTAFGGLAGAVGRGVDARARSEAEQRLATLKTTQEARIALNEGIDALVRGEDIKLSPNSTEPMAWVQQQIVTYPDAQERQAAIDRIVNTDMPVGEAPQKPVTLMQFLSSKSVGGIKDEGGELASMGLSRKFVPGGGALVTKAGKTLDYAREAAAEAGFFDHIYGDPQTAVAKSTPDDLLRLLAQEQGGTPAFSDRVDGGRKHQNDIFTHDQAAQERYRRTLDEVNGAIDTLGITHKIDDSILRHAAELSAQDGMDPIAALEHAIDADYRAFADAMDERGQGFSNEPDFNIPFFEDTRAGSQAGRDAGQASGDGAPGGRSTNAADSQQSARSGGTQGQAIDTTAARGDAPPDGIKQAEASVAKPEDAKNLAEQYRVDPKTGSFAEEGEVAQLAAEGRLTEHDVATLAQAQADYETGSAYAEALKSVASCLL